MSVIFILGAVASLAKSGGAQCTEDYSCSFTVNDPQDNNAAFNFDFSSMCSGSDYTVDDGSGHVYYANVCQKAKVKCLPADCDNYPYCVPWTNTYNYGNAVQMWGKQPPFPAKDPSLDCKDPLQPSNTVPCTKACQVLGVGSPSWQLTNPADPANSDVIGNWRGVPPKADDPFYCPDDPLTGAPQSRQVSMVFQCAPGLSTPQLYKAEQNTTENCHYKLYFKTKNACLDSGMSAGSAFLLVLFVGALVYFLGGGLFNYLAHGKFQILHKAFWQGLPALVMDGVHFLKDKVMGRTQTFNSVPATDAGASYDAAAVSYQLQQDKDQPGPPDAAAAAAYADL